MAGRGDDEPGKVMTLERPPSADLVEKGGPQVELRPVGGQPTPLPGLTPGLGPSIAPPAWRAS